MNLSSIQKEAVERFEKEFGSEVIEHFQTYAYTEGHEKPLKEAKEKLEDMESLLSETIKSSILAAFEAVEVRDIDPEDGLKMYRDNLKYELGPGDDMAHAFNEANARRREKENKFMKS